MPPSATPAPSQPPADTFLVFRERILGFAKYLVGRAEAARIADAVVAELAAAGDPGGPVGLWDRAVALAVARIPVQQLLARFEPLFAELDLRTLHWLRLKVEGLDDAQIQQKMGADSPETLVRWRQEALADLLARLRSREEP